MGTLLALLILVPGVLGLVVGLSDRKIRPWVLAPLAVMSLLIVMAFIGAKSSNPGENDAAYWGLGAMILFGLFWAEVMGVVAGIVWLLRQRGPRSDALWYVREDSTWSTIRPYVLSVIVVLVVFVLLGGLASV